MNETTKRTTRITLETDEVLIVRRRPAPGWCEGCARQVEMLSPEQAAAAGLSVRAVYRRVEVGRLHFTETPEGQVWVCLNSLLA
jgi:hypothetical protein